MSVNTNQISNVIGSIIPGVTNSLTVTNPSDTAGSQSKITLTVGGSAASDTWQEFAVGSSRSYAHGIDNSDSDKLKLTTAAAATANPSTATPAWELLPGTGFTYDNSGATSYGIGFNATPDPNYSINAIKSSLNGFFGFQITNSNAGNDSKAGINFINNTPTGTSISMVGNADAIVAARNHFLINADQPSTLGIVYNVGLSGNHVWYGSVSTGNLLMTLSNTSGLVMSRTIDIGTNQITTSRITAPTTGKIGEQIRSAVAPGAAVALTSNVYANMTSISLTAGVWDVSLVMAFTSPSVTPTLTAMNCAISANSASPTGAILGDNFIVWPASGAPVTGVADSHMTIPAWRVVLSSTTTYFAVTRCIFSAGNISAYGRLSAIRVA